MGVGYSLVNQSKKECIGFLHMAGSKAREIAGNPALASVVAWYMLENQGDSIQFVSNTYDDWPFHEGERADLAKYNDVTSVYIEKLVAEGILSSEGYLYLDEDEPEDVYILNIKNVWLKNA